MKATQQLRELERDGLIARTGYNEKPLRVDYRLTELGASLQPIGLLLEEWGHQHMGEVKEAREAYDSER